jgi:hypothetical protein
MNALTSLHDTNTKEYNIARFQEIGLSVIAGKLAKGDLQRQAILRVLPATYDKLTNWLAEDFDHNAAIVDSIAIRLASLFNTEQVIDLCSDNPQPQLHDNLLAAFEERLPLLRSQETLNLAERVAELGVDGRSIEKWADELSKDISKGND